ncbi:MAG: hypothetical protein LBM77_04725 [Spirochaetaceae bacterium]|jgi:hypothetical protein|nr:hypothetical protein [Spirochaetaceae bacterium]
MKTKNLFSFGIAARMLCMLMVGISLMLTACPPPAGSGDRTAPTVGVPTVAAITQITATATFTSDEEGTYYYLVLPSATEAPEASAIVEAASGVFGYADAVEGSNTISLTGLTANTAYKIYLIVKDDAGNLSKVMSSVEWTTLASDPDDKTAPTVSVPTVAEITQTTAKVTFSSDEAGTYYYLVLPSSDAAPEASAIVGAASGVFGSASAVEETNTINLTGLSAGTAYKIHLVVEDAAENVSLVMSSAAWTTSSPNSDITGVTVTPAEGTYWLTGMYYMDRGGTLQLNAAVTGENSPSQDVTWSLEGEYTDGTSISSTGLLTLDADETGFYVTAKATAQADTSKSASFKVAQIDSGWNSFTNSSSVTGSFTIDDNGSNTIVLSGTPGEYWYGGTGYFDKYAETTGKRYKIQFDTWIENSSSENPKVQIMYYHYIASDRWTGFIQQITNTKTTYSFVTQTIGEDQGMETVDFWLGKQTGTVHIENVSVTETEDAPTPAWEVYYDTNAGAGPEVTYDLLSEDRKTAKVTVSGTPNSNAWSSQLQYPYGSEAGKKYRYKFKLWTDSGTYTINYIEYQWIDGISDKDSRIGYNIPVSTTPKTIEWVGAPLIGNAHHRLLLFAIGDKTGSFNIEMVSIEETEDDPSIALKYEADENSEVPYPDYIAEFDLADYISELNTNNTYDYSISGIPTIDSDDVWVRIVESHADPDADGGWLWKAFYESKESEEPDITTTFTASSPFTISGNADISGIWGNTFPEVITVTSGKHYIQILAHVTSNLGIQSISDCEVTFALEE